MAIFNSYVKLPESISSFQILQKDHLNQENDHIPLESAM